MASSNPAFTIFEKIATLDRPTRAAMTIEGATTKAFALVVMAFVTALGSYAFGDPVLILPCSILSTVLAFIMIFKPQLAPMLAPVYAIAEGAALGVVSLMFERQYPGIAVHAIMGTLGTLAGMLVLYRAKVITYSDKFATILASAMIGISLIYVADLILAFFSMRIGFVHDSSPIGIAFSVGVVIVAALNFIADFAAIEKGVKEGAPKYMEWYCAFGLLLTVVWLYLEILRLLAKLRSRDDD